MLAGHDNRSYTDLMTTVTARRQRGTGLPPFGMPVATLGIRLSLLHIRLVLIAGSGLCDSFCSKISVLAGFPMMP